MRTKLTFKVYGSTINSIKSEALTQIEEFLNGESIDIHNNIEIDIVEIETSDSKTMYQGTVYVKL